MRETNYGQTDRQTDTAARQSYLKRMELGWLFLFFGWSGRVAKGIIVEEWWVFVRLGRLIRSKLISPPRAGGSRQRGEQARRCFQLGSHVVRGGGVGVGGGGGRCC